MSDHAVQKSEESDDGMVGGLLHSHESIWMTRWTQTNVRREFRVHNVSPCERAIKGGHTRQHLLLSQVKRASASLDSTLECKQLRKATPADITASFLKPSSQKSNKRLDPQPFPLSGLSGNRRDVSVLETDQSTSYQRKGERQMSHDSGNESIALGKNGFHFPSVIVQAPSGMKSLSSDCELQPAGTLLDRDQQAKSYDSSFEKNFTLLRASQDAARSASNAVPCTFKGRKIPAQSLLWMHKVNHSSSVVAPTECFFKADDHVPHEHCNYHSYSGFIHEKRVDNYLESRNSGQSLEKGKIRSISHDSLLQNHQIPDSIGHQFEKIGIFRNVGSLPSTSSPSQTFDSEKSSNSFNSRQGNPCLLDKIKPIFLEAPYKRDTHANLHERGQAFSKSSMRLKRSMLYEFLGRPAGMDSHRHQGLKLRSFGKAHCEEKVDAEIIRRPATSVSSREQLSAETEAIDDSAFGDGNHCCAEASSASYKHFSDSQLPPASQATASSSAKGYINQVSSKRIIHQLPVLPDDPGVIDKMKQSASPTKYLDLEGLLSQIKQPTSSNSSPCLDNTKELEPSSRWVKRLRLTQVDFFGHGTKSSKIGEALFPEKVNKFFSKVVKCSRTDSDTVMWKHCGNEQTKLDQAITIPEKSELAHMDSKKERDTLKSWIQRWCKDQSPLLQEGTVLSQGPQSVELVAENSKNQCASVKAMALMGKAMSKSHPCEFENRGGLVVWHTEGIL